MTNFNWYIDGSIVIIYLIVIISIGLWMRRFVHNVADYLVAGRQVDLYLGIASLAATEFGIVTCMANAELGYKYGFAGITPGIMFAIAMFVVGWTGLGIRPLREQEAITLPELFDKKFGQKVRIASGVVIVLGGLLNMGVFLRMAGDFLTVVMDIDIQYLEILMTCLLLIVALYTILGGMMSVLVTDYFQFILMSIGLLAVTGICFYQFGWENLTAHLEATHGAKAFNPFHDGAYGVDRIILDLLVAFAAVLTWQTMLSRVLSAKDAETGQKIYKATAPFFLVRFGIPAFLGIAAFYYFSQSGNLPEKDIMALPNFIAEILPVGLLGLLIAGMLAADMSTNSSYLLAWSSVIYNDILAPFHKHEWSAKKSLYTNRMLVAGIGIFLLLYGLWYPLKGDLWGYLQVTGTVYLASMSVILLATCYWDKANDWGAIAAILVGSILPISFLVMQQVDQTKALANSIGPYKSGIATYFLTASAMIIGSYLKRSLNMNLSNK